jgi:hypothetical protein
MMRVGSSGTAAGFAAGYAAIVVMCAALAACGDDGAAATGQTASATPPSYPITRGDASGTATAMQIKGSPGTTATVGQAYSFQPTVASTAGAAVGSTMKFSIANPPAWGKFDPTSGKLTGTPNATQVGTYPNIAISVVSGATTAALPAFSIVVTDSNSQNNVTLSWQAPTDNADGTALVDLKGYKVHYGASSKSYSSTIQVSNPGLTTYVVENLVAGKYYFAVTAYNSAGVESSLSPEVSTQVD